MPVVDYYRKQGKVVDVRAHVELPARAPSLTLCLLQIDSAKSIEDVYADIKSAIEPVLGA